MHQGALKINPRSAITSYHWVALATIGIWAKKVNFFQSYSEQIPFVDLTLYVMFRVKRSIKYTQQNIICVLYFLYVLYVMRLHQNFLPTLFILTYP